MTKHAVGQPLPRTAAAPATYCCSRYYIRLQPLVSTAAASITYGCSLYYLRLQPLLPTVAAYFTYGCSLGYLRLQVAFADRLLLNKVDLVRVEA